MRILPFSRLPVTPWKNGGGVTREIAAAHAGEGLVWRLSVADVDSDGPFSNFAGLTRILTVTGGNGMELASPAGMLHALPFQPLRFDGGLNLEARLADGPLRDLNLIFDPLACEGEVIFLCGPLRRNLQANPGLIHAVHVLRGPVGAGQAGALQPGDTALSEAGGMKLHLAAGAAVLLVTLAFPAQTDASKAVTALR